MLLAQHLWNYLDQGRFHQGGFEGFVGSSLRRSIDLNARITNSADAARVHDGVVDFSTVLVDFTLGVLTKNIPAKVEYSLILLERGLSGLSDINVDLPSQNDFVFTQASYAAGTHNRYINELIFYGGQIRSAGGRVSDSLVAFGFIHAFYMVQLSIAGLEMGANHFERYLTVSPWEVTWSIVSGSLLSLGEQLGRTFDSAFNFVGIDAAGNPITQVIEPVVDIMQLISDSFENPHVTRWVFEHNRANAELMYWLR